jgi:nucleotide-binding universal stress UspA family protein
MDWLDRRHLHAERRPMQIGGPEAGAVLLRAAIEFRADLLVMGAYGRTRFSEWLLGGATQHVLCHAELPVLMQH